MIPLNVILREPAWPDLSPDDPRLIKTPEGVVLRIDSITALPNGTVGGKPSIAIRIDLPDGRVVLAETTMALMLAAMDMFKAKYGDPRE